MPLVKINLRKGRTEAEKDALAQAVQSALVAELGVPDEDRYQLFVEYEPGNFRHTPAYLGITYSDQLLILELTFVTGRSDEVKKSLLRALAENLAGTGLVSVDDVFVMVTEIAPVNVSFGQGFAQRAPAVA